MRVSVYIVCVCMLFASMSRSMGLDPSFDMECKNGVVFKVTTMPQLQNLTLDVACELFNAKPIYA